MIAWLDAAIPQSCALCLAQATCFNASMSDPTNKPSSPPSQPPSAEGHQAKEEFLAAMTHFKNAASLFMGRVQKDPTLRDLGQQAEHAIKSLETAARPVTKQVTSELSKLGKALTDALDGTRKSDMPPPPSGPRPSATPSGSTPIDAASEDKSG